MVGVTGIEPVTPTMSTLFPPSKPVLCREESATSGASVVVWFILCSDSEVRRT